MIDERNRQPAASHGSHISESELCQRLHLDRRDFPAMGDLPFRMFGRQKRYDLVEVRQHLAHEEKLARKARKARRQNA